MDNKIEKSESYVLNCAGYSSLANVLSDAFKQASEGKGKERHARGQPFDEQHMQSISTILGTDRGMAYQAIKKITEGLDFAEFDRMERELLGAINYVAGIIIWHRKRLPAPPKLPSVEQ